MASVMAKGEFVGKTVDGPIGVIGLWGVDHDDIGSGHLLQGAFGAETAP